MKESRNVIARLRLESGDAVPEGAVAEVMETGQRVPIGLDGTLYLSGVSDAVTVEAVWADASCRVHVPAGERGRPVYNAGELLCESQ